MNLPNYWEGKKRVSATEETLRNRAIREGQVTGGKGVTVSRTGNGTTVSVLPQVQVREPEGQLALATGTTPTAIGSGTVIPISTVENTLNGESSLFLVSLDANVLTFRRAGVYKVSFNLAVGYSVSTGTSGATMKEAKTSAYFETGGVSATESTGWHTLSSRVNLSKKVECTADDGIVFYHSTHTMALTSEPDSDEPSDWHGSAAANGTWMVWASEVAPSSNNLLVEGAQIMTTMTRVTAYASSLFEAGTVPGMTMVRVVFDVTSNGLKILRGGSYYPPTLSLKASVTYGGEGTVDPVAQATAATVMVERISALSQVVIL
jgi:hypothetical protein